MAVITEPCLIDGMSDEAYHLDPVPRGSLSSSGARELLGCAAKYAYSQENGRPDTDAFKIGRVAHALILGTGSQYVPLPFESWTTKDARAARDKARADGLVPLKISEFAEVSAMAAAFAAAPAAALLSADGKPERSLFWIDEATGVWCRARLDWSNGLTTVDVKTTEDASKEGFALDAARYGYNVQQAFYERGLRALGLAGDLTPEFIFACVEKKQPHLTATYRLDAEALHVGDLKVSRALEKFAECQRTAVWPGYPAEIVTVSLPRWATYLPEEGS